MTNDQIINYAVKEGLLGGEAEEWSEEEKQNYVNKCE